MTTYRAEQRGDLWTVEPWLNERRAYWHTQQPAAEMADRLNHEDGLRMAIKHRLPSGCSVSVEDIGGGRRAWAIDFDRFGGEDGPRLLLTDDTEADDTYTLGIYDTRQEVPGGAEPIIERTGLRSRAAQEGEPHYGRMPGARADSDTVAQYVADRARFVLSLATAEADRIIEAEEMERAEAGE